MFTHLIIQLNLWQRSRENPIYGKLNPSTIGADICLLASYNNQIGRPTGLYSGTIGGLLPMVLFLQRSLLSQNRYNLRCYVSPETVIAEVLAQYHFVMPARLHATDPCHTVFSSVRACFGAVDSRPAKRGNGPGGAREGGTRCDRVGRPCSFSRR